MVGIYAQCAPRTRTQALRRRRHWLIAASTIDWSNCAHSSIRRVLSSSTSAILLSAIFSVEYLISRNYYPILRGALCQIDDANMSNLILTITALGSNLEHLHLTR